MVSHDLRSPLNVVDGSLRLAERTGDAEHFARCRRAVERMDALVGDLLSLARAGMELREQTDVALGSLARECWQTAPTAEATLRVETEAVVRADEGRLRQLLENLFRNSVEHGSPDDTDAAADADRGAADPADDGHVTVTVGDLPDGFFVADDGPGIPESERERVFESGYSSQRDGTGFGLDIVRRVADVHGWEVTLTESAAGGARFEFTGVTRSG
jgi:signal transduction histidine kinase